MKKSYIYLLAVAGLLTACDPSKDDISMPGSDLTSEQLSDGFTFKQYSDETYTTEAADGNYFTFFTSPSRVVRIYQKDAEGAENVLFSGAANGSFKIVPKRGNPTSQTFYVETMNFDGTKIVAEKTVNVYVPSELAPEMRIIASDAYGYKVWKWNPVVKWDDNGTIHYGSWGNCGYYADNGNNYSGANVPGAWFACEPENLVGQLQHSDTGVATGEEDPNAYMEFYDDGTIKTYSGAGNQIRSGKFSIEGWTGERIPNADGTPWSLGKLKTTEGAILFPFKINGGGEKPTEFEIMQLSNDNLILIYAPEGTGGWSEATWWNFKSNSDGVGMLSNNDKKAWTWGQTFWIGDGGVENHGSWGNCGYYADNGNNYGGANLPGAWFACEPEDLVGQLQHSDTGVATGEEDPNAYMEFDASGNIVSYNASGNQIRSGKYELIWNNGNRTNNADGTPWNLGTLKTTAGSILFPFKINGGGEKPTEFEVMNLSDDNLILIYAPAGTGGWAEATWWNFKKK